MNDLVSHNESNVKKQAEYQAFIKLVGEGKIPPNWEDMASALAVRPATISAWKKLPEFQEALLKGINESFNRMSVTGQRQWQMWRERYAMLIHEKEKQENKTTVNVLVMPSELMDKYAITQTTSDTK